MTEPLPRITNSVFDIYNNCNARYPLPVLSHSRSSYFYFCDFFSYYNRVHTLKRLFPFFLLSLSLSLFLSFLRRVLSLIVNKFSPVPPFLPSSLTRSLAFLFPFSCSLHVRRTTTGRSLAGKKRRTNYRTRMNYLEPDCRILPCPENFSAALIVNVTFIAPR